MDAKLFLHGRAIFVSMVFFTPFVIKSHLSAHHVDEFSRRRINGPVIKSAGQCGDSV
jgi:hypothetical protein